MSSPSHWRDPQPDDQRYKPKTPDLPGGLHGEIHMDPLRGGGGTAPPSTETRSTFSGLGLILCLASAFGGYLIGDWQLANFQDVAVRDALETAKKLSDTRTALELVAAKLTETEKQLTGTKAELAREKEGWLKRFARLDQLEAEKKALEVKLDQLQRQLEFSKQPPRVE